MAGIYISPLIGALQGAINGITLVSPLLALGKDAGGADAGSAKSGSVGGSMKLEPVDSGGQLNSTGPLYNPGTQTTGMILEVINPDISGKSGPASLPTGGSMKLEYAYPAGQSKGFDVKITETSSKDGLTISGPTVTGGVRTSTADFAKALQAQISEEKLTAKVRRRKKYAKGE